MIIVDTGFWLALADQRDTYHQRAIEALKRYDEPLITTWCVVTETCHLLLSRKGSYAQTKFINGLAHITPRSQFVEYRRNLGGIVTEFGE